MKISLFASIALLLFAIVVVNAQSPKIEEIKISSGWGGLGKPQHSELMITRSGGAYHGNGEKISEELINELSVALRGPIIKEPELANLGITKEWLAKNAEPGAREYGNGYILGGAPNQRDLFFSSYTDPAFITKLLPEVFRGGWTDDYPFIEIKVKTQDGNIIKVSSDAQPIFMLPWNIEENGRKIKTYNAQISRSIANLLPKDFTNGERLSGTDLREELAEKVARDIEEDWNRLDAENRAGSYIEQIRARFNVSQLEINEYHNVEYGIEWTEAGPKETNLHASLSRADFPRNFFIGLVLPLKEKKVENVDLFLKVIDRYQRSVETVPWLHEYLVAHPEITVELKFVNDQSLGEKAMRVFASDMKALGKDALIREVQEEQKDVSLILVGSTYSQSYWLVLPDKRMVLWRFKADNSLLKWKRNDFSLKDCPDYQDWPPSQCVGAIISPTGSIIPK